MFTIGCHRDREGEHTIIYLGRRQLRLPNACNCAPQHRCEDRTRVLVHHQGNGRRQGRWVGWCRPGREQSGPEQLVLLGNLQWETSVRVCMWVYLCVCVVILSQIHALLFEFSVYIGDCLVVPKTTQRLAYNCRKNCIMCYVSHIM